MSSLFGMGGAKTQAPIRYTAISIQTSTQGVPIPIGWGANRVGINLIWYNDFQSVAGSSSAGGKGGGSPITSYTYSAAVELALGEGPIQGINQVWADRDLTTLANLNLTLYVGSSTQVPPPFVSASFPAQALAYANTAYLFSSKYALGTSPNLPSHNFEVAWPLCGSIPGYSDANFADIIFDYCTNARYGIGLPSSAIDATSLALGATSGSGYWTYCTAQGLLASPYLSSQEQGTNTLQRWAQLSNTWIFFSGGQMKFVPLGDSSITANGVTYTPNNAAVAALTLADFVIKKSGDPPVRVTRSDPFDGYNRVQLDCLERANSYNNATVQWQDQTSIDQFGELQSQTINANEICVPAIGSIVAALVGQRLVWIRNKYSFTLDYTHILLEVGDIISLYEPVLGLLAVTVRITDIQENEEQLLDITAEEFNIGVGTPNSGNIAQAALATPIVNTLVDPGNINTPMITAPPSLTSASQPQLWFGLSGGADWGGARIYVSFNGGDSYNYLGTVSVGLAQGTLLSDLSAHADPDTADTLAVDLVESNTTLSSAATHDDADHNRTLCFIPATLGLSGDEFLSFGECAIGATANRFNLKYLRRGQYGTGSPIHYAGTQFYRVDNQFTFTYSIPPGYTGIPLLFKFLSFNVFNNALQTLDQVDTWAFTPTASGTFIPGPGGAGASSGGSSDAGGGGPGAGGTG